MKTQTGNRAIYFRVVRILLVSVLLCTTIFGASGDVDTSFNSSFYKQPAGEVWALAQQTDGKILFGGTGFEIVNSRRKTSSIVRFNTDNTIDTTFNASRVTGLILAIGLQSDGKIIIAGNIRVDGILLGAGVIRLHQDGSIENMFNLPLLTGTTFGGNISALSISPDDRVLIGGGFSYFPASGGARRRGIARLNANGVTDDTFYAGDELIVAPDLEVQSDGKILGAGVSDGGSSWFLKRLNPDGTTDSTFNTLTQGIASEYEIQADGKVLIGGSFSNVNNFAKRSLARLNADGSLDQTFSADNFNTINDLELDVTGKVLVNGTFTAPGGTRFDIARLNSDGSLDLTFEFIKPAGTGITVQDILPQADGNFIIGGTGSAMGVQGSQVYRISATGAIDPNLKVLTGSRGTVWEMVTQADGKVLIGGVFRVINNIVKPSIARINTDGTLDTTFNPVILGAGVDPGIRAMDVQPDGKIIVGGQFFDMLIRLNPDGTRDTSFSTNLATSGPIYDLRVLPDGKILAVGEINVIGQPNNSRVVRFNSNGSINTTFQVNPPNSTVFKLLTLTDGKFYICGQFSDVGGATRNRIARMNSDGSLDTSFNPLGGANSIVYDMGLQSDGKLIIGGLFTAVNGVNRTYLARLNPNGSTDTTFNVALDASMSGIRVQTDNRILIGGSFFNVNGNASKGVARLKADGQFDPTFNAGPGVDGVVFAFEPQAGNKLLIGGQFTLYKNTEKLSIVRVSDDSAVNQRRRFDFDGDGRSDVSVFRPGTNRWYELLSSNSTVFEETFGASGDIVAPADYDGDGKTDIGIFRPASGDWWYRSSVDNQQKNVQFGANGDIPRPSDFDGDGKDDFVVFRPSNNTWYRLSQTGAVSIVNFGTAGDKPVIGDFDGDGKSDVAIFRPSSGDWWYQSSFNNAQLAAHFGISTDIPVPADYDGDGKTDFAVYRPADGVWYIYNSSNGQVLIVSFGLSADKPVPADYDGDGRADIAVYRPSTGVWYLLRTTAGFGALNFGISTDIPLANAFVP